MSAALLAAEAVTSWPEAFATVGTMAAFAFVMWVIFRD